MLYKAKKGQASYGEAIGILLLDTSFAPYIPGDVANASSYSFPVRYKVIKGLTVEKIFQKDTSFLNQLIEGGKELVKNGVRAVTGNCGFMALFQREAVQQLGVPVFLSSLLQLTFMTKMISEGEKIGIITANGKSLDDNLLREVGITDMNKFIIRGMEDKEHFRKSINEEIGWLDEEKVKKEVVSVAQEIIREESKEIPRIFK